MTSSEPCHKASFASFYHSSHDNRSRNMIHTCGDILQQVKLLVYRHKIINNFIIQTKSHQRPKRQHEVKNSNFFYLTVTQEPSETEKRLNKVILCSSWEDFGGLFLLLYLHQSHLRPVPADMYLYWWRNFLLVSRRLSCNQEKPTEFRAVFFRPEAVLNAGGNGTVKQRACTNPRRSVLRSHRKETPQWQRSGSGSTDFLDPSHDGPKDENEWSRTFTEL